VSNASDARPPYSLGQLDQSGDPLLLPITPGSSVEEIARLVRESGAARVELLVPDKTDALQSAEGACALRDAAVASGVRLTIFTADDRIAQAASEANLDVFGVGAKVAAPRPRRVERLDAEAPAQQPARFAAAPVEAVPPAPAAEEPPFEPDMHTAPELPASEPAAAASMPGAAADDTDFLSRLDAFDHPAAAEGAPESHAAEEQPRLGRSSQGAILFDAPGDLGVPRPTDYVWPAAAYDQVDAPADDEPAPLPAATLEAPSDEEPAFVPEELEQEQAEPAGGGGRPSMLAALFGFLPARATAGAAPAAPHAQRSAPKQALSARIAGATAPARPRPVPVAQPQPRHRGFKPAWLLIPLLLLVGSGLVWFADVDLRSAAASFVPSVAPSLEIEPPLRSTEAVQMPDTLVPLVSEPVSDASSSDVQGIVLSAPVTIAVEGTATTTTLLPFSKASGTLLFSNPSSQPITIPAGTPTQANGLEFTFDESVTVPAAVSDFAGTRNGQATARLTARLPGAQGNIVAGTITSVPGYTGGAGPLRVLQEQAFAGGSDAEVVIVTPDDVNRLLPEALTKLYAKGVQDINAALAAVPGFELAQTQGTTAISPTQQLLADVQLGDFEVFPAIGQVVSPELNGVFRLSMTRQFEALANPVDQPIDEQLRRAVANLRNREGGSVTPEEVQITGWRRADGGLRVDAVITPRAGYQEVPPERAEQIAASIRGRSVAEARAELERLRSEGLIGSYQLPEDWQAVPDGVVVKLAPREASPAQP